MNAAAEPGIFISFANEDRPYAELVKGYLLGRDRLVWSDEEIAPGEDWDDEIARSMGASQAVILLVSPAFLRSPRHLYEAGVALAKEQQKEGKVIPIVIGDVDPADLPVRLRRSRLLDARGIDRRRVLSQVDERLAS